MKSTWKNGRVNDLIDYLESGVSVNGEDHAPSDTEPAVLKVSAVSYGVFDPSASKPIVGQELKRAKCNPKAGQIIISRSNTPDLVGASAFISRDYPNRYLPDKLWQTVTKKDVASDLRWLAYYLASSWPRFRLSRLATGTSDTMKNITQDELLTLPVLIPPLTEQTAIADLLSTWDAAIEKTERLIAAKERQKNSLMQQLLTGKQRLFGFQKPWSEFHLGELFKERSERASDHLPLLSITSGEGVIPRSEGRKDTSSEDKSNYLRICPGDIGYNTMRMWQGVSALSSLEGIVSPAYTICTPKKSVDGEFMAYLFKLPRVVNLFYRHSQGLTSDTWNLKYQHFQKIKVTIPEIEEQRAIAAILKAIDKEIDLLKKQAEAYRRQKRGLMQKLLTGEWRVRISKEVVNG